MRKLLVLVLVLIPFFIYSQSLGTERVKRLKKSVVRVTIENSNSTGTGFVLNESGFIATCFHVIEDAFLIDTINTEFRIIRKIFVEFQSGEKLEFRLSKSLLNPNSFKNSYAYDYAVLEPIKSPKTRYLPLKIGKWESISEGDKIYSCGFPLGIKQQFISKGILSTKWLDKKSTNFFNIRDTFKINVAWLDLTLNPGNSGGPIIKMADNPEDDEVIGIATFILNPFARDALALKEHIEKTPNIIHYPFDNFDKDGAISFLANSIYSNSIGVSGAVSIDYLTDLLSLMKD